MGWLVVDFNPFPWELDLIALILGIIGTVLGLVALPTVFQMFWGRPNITIDFDSRDFGERHAEVLRCRVFNSPVSGRLLRKMGITRSVAHIFVTFTVREVGTNRPIIENVLTTKQIQEGAHSTITLQPSLMPKVFPLVTIESGGESGFVLREGSKRDSDLEVGIYKAIVSVSAAEKNFQASRQFTIGRSLEECYWKSN
jgi:hypothetical protein